MSRGPSRARLMLHKTKREIFEQERLNQLSKYNIQEQEWIKEYATRKEMAIWMVCDLLEASKQIDDNYTISKEQKQMFIENVRKGKKTAIEKKNAKIEARMVATTEKVA